MGTSVAPVAPEGETWLGLTAAPLPVAEAVAWAVRPDCGGLVLFSGTARDHAEGRPGVERLEYEAYESQVVPRLGAVADEARSRWPTVGRIALLHRIGRARRGRVGGRGRRVGPPPGRGVRGGAVLHRHAEAVGAHLEA